MNGPHDLRGILNEWEYDEEDNVRFITGDDGRDVMQIRQPLGIEQYDLDGRPDGFKPEGAGDFLDLYLKSEASASSRGNVLVLKDEDFLHLQGEGILYYQRYLALFQVGQYDRVARDTDHNLRICSLLERRYPGEQRFEILQYRPYILRMNAISRAMIHLADDHTAEALEELENGLKAIENMHPVPTSIYEFEKIRSLQHLGQIISQVGEEHKDSEPGKDLKGFKARLTEELSKAVENEDYERAARLRDRLQGLD